MSIFFGLLLARRFYCRSALSFFPGITGGFLPRINAPKKGAVAFRMQKTFFRPEAVYRYCEWVKKG